MKKKTAKRMPQKTQRTRVPARTKPRKEAIPASATAEMVDIMAAMRDLLVEIRDLLSARAAVGELEAIVVTEPEAEEDLE